MELSEGANVRHKNRDGETSLMAAAGRNHSNVVKVLLATGSFNTDNKKDALRVAASKGYDEVAAILIFTR